MTVGGGERHSHESSYLRAQRLLSERLKASVSEEVEFVEGDGHSHTVDFRDNLLSVGSYGFFGDAVGEGTVALKIGLRTRGILPNAVVRSPLVDLTAEAETQIADAIKAAGLA